jgi:hypothetical protein
MRSTGSGGWWARSRRKPHPEIAGPVPGRQFLQVGQRGPQAFAEHGEVGAALLRVGDLRADEGLQLVAHVPACAGLPDAEQAPDLVQR